MSTTNLRDTISTRTGFGPDAEDGIYLGVPEAEYHNHPALSRSVLAKAARYSPAHAYYDWKEDDEEYSTDATSLGRAVHSYVLTPGVFEEEYGVTPESCEGTYNSGDPCTASPKNRYDGTWYCGRHNPDQEPDEIEGLSPSKYEKIEGMTGALQRDPDTIMLLFEGSGLTEVTILWTDEVTGLQCKARLDRVVEINGSLHVVDLKTTRSAHPDDFRRSISKYGYWLQPVFYPHGLRELVDMPVRSFVFACVESDKPFVVQCFQLADETRKAAARRLSSLMSSMQQAVEEGVREGYHDGVAPIDMKRYEKERLELRTDPS